MKTANMTVQQILASNNNGQGKTNNIAQSANIVGDVITFNNSDYTVRWELQAAKLLQYFSRENNPADVLETLAAGYLGKLHQKTMENGTEEKKPSEQVKRLLTADEYLSNCLKLAVIDVTALYNQLLTFSDKSTKADLLVFVESLKVSLVSPEQWETYTVMMEKETALNQLKLDYGFYDFRKFVGESGQETIRAKVSIDGWKQSKAYLETNFKFLLAIQAETDEFGIPLSFDVTFREKTENEK